MLALNMTVNSDTCLTTQLSVISFVLHVQVNVVPADDSKAMSMESFKDQVLRVGQQASFAVQMKGKKGKISASVSSPSGAKIECSVAELDEGMRDHRCILFLTSVRLFCLLFQELLYT